MTTQPASAERKPPVFVTAWQAWRFAFAAFSRMPVVLGIAMALMFVLNAATLPLVSAPAPERGFGLQALDLVLMLVQGFLLAPVAIALHRFVLLGELTGSYAPNPSDPRFMRFFLFSVAFQLMMDIPARLMSEFSKSDSATGGVLAFASFVLFIATLIVALRVLIVFPAIAVDAPGTHWRNAYFDSKGHTWRVFGIFLVVSLPVIAFLIPVYFLFATPDGPGLILSAVQATASVLMVAAFAAAASLIFAAISDRLNERMAG